MTDNTEKLNDREADIEVVEGAEETTADMTVDTAEETDVDMTEETAADMAEETAAEAVEEKTPENKGKKKVGRRKKQLIIIAALFLAVLACLPIALNMTDTDSRFIRAVNGAILKSWALENNEVELKDSTAPNDTSFINIEYNAVKNFSKSKFKDKELGNLAAKYISALEGCRSAVKENDPDKDYDQFWSSFSQSYGQRVEALYDLYKGNYCLNFDELESSEERDEFLLTAWSLKKTAEIKFTRSKKEKSEDEDEEGSALEANSVLTATVRNDSGFDLEYINIEVELYDENGELIEETTAYADNVKKDAEFELKCYQIAEGKADSYLITSVSCKRKVKEAQESAAKDGEQAVESADNAEETGTEPASEDTAEGDS